MKSLKELWGDRVTIRTASLPVPLAGLEDRRSDELDLALILTNKCKAACAHCYNFSGPKGTMEISSAKLNSILSSGRIMERKIGRVGFSGGEPFSYYGLNQLVETAKSSGISVACITGGIGVVPSEIDELAASGCDKLTVSYDRFHSKFFCEDDFVSFVNTAAKYINTVTVQFVTSTTDQDVNLMHRILPRIEEKVRMTILPLSHTGRAAHAKTKENLQSDKVAMKLSDIPSFVRNADQIVVNFDEWIFGVCDVAKFGSENRICRLDDLIF
ncbi:radical SAM protein [uncultured Roseobacter sp.]|uniref:radical SAM protein n=1 Tax=uncultured Roseobacter sp. TaxID=114847 RepID=UPI0026156B36|nr:radical SAM protein [uncultured Roseobacter sp.]